MKELMVALKGSGYATQTDVAKALYKTGLFPDSSAQNVRAYFNQVLNGKRPMSDALESALRKVAAGNERAIEILDNSLKPLGKLDSTLYKLFREYVGKLDVDFPKIGRDHRMKILEGLEKLCLPEKD